MRKSCSEKVVKLGRDDQGPRLGQPGGSRNNKLPAITKCEVLAQEMTHEKSSYKQDQQE